MENTYFTRVKIPMRFRSRGGVSTQLSNTSQAGTARRFALIGLSVFIVDRVVFSYMLILRGILPILRATPIIPVTGVLFDWVLPILIVRMVEKRDLRSLGIAVGPGRYPIYGLFAIVTLVLPAFLVGLDMELLMEFAEQFTYIAVAEEVFFRGFLMTRFCEWLGDRKGLLLNGVAFGLGHVTSLMSQHGFRYVLDDSFVGFQTFLGGLMLGYLYLKSKSIVPGCIIHLSGNAYLSRILEVLGG